jgi:hypothetical protein
MMLWRNSLPSAAYSFCKCKETFWWCLCSNRKWWVQRHKLSSIPNLPPPPGPYGALYQSLLPFPCHMSFLSYELTYFSLISLGRGSSWTTTTGCSAMSVFPSLKGFTNPMS